MVTASVALLLSKLQGEAKGSSLPSFVATMSNVRHLVVASLEMPGDGEVQRLQELLAGSNIVVICLPSSLFECENGKLVRTALAAARTRVPPLGGVLYLGASRARLSPASAGAVVAAAPLPTPAVPDARERVLAALSGALDADIIAQLEAGEPFMASGVNSTLAVQVVGTLEDSLGVAVPGTVIFDYPTLDELVEFLAAELPGGRNVAVEGPNNVPGIIPTVAPGARRGQRQVRRRGAGGPAIAGVEVLAAAAAPGPAAPLHVDLSSMIASVCSVVADALNEGEVDVDAPLMSMGVNSTMAVQLVSSLEAIAGEELPGTLVFDYPTVREIAKFIAEVGGGAGVAASAPVPASSMGVVPRSIDHALSPAAPEPSICSIVSIAGAVPGGDLAYTSHRGNDRIDTVPLERWDVDQAPFDNPKELNLQFGSFVDGADVLDARLFNVSPAEALLMDPQQRMLLTQFLHSWNDYLAQPRRVFVRETGIFVGVSQLDYARIAYETGSALNTYYATGSHLSVTSGRISYTFGFKGPAMTIDTACSSSLVATHIASTSIYDGLCHVAGALGTNLALVHSWTRACLRAGMLADDGRCKTLDASADGYVRAEAAVSMILEGAGLSDGADVSDGFGGADGASSDSTILGYLVGTAVNQDGRSSALTAPNGPSQQDVIRSALASGGVAASDITHLQMHGTGTPLGDPIELGAATAVLIGKAAVERAVPLQLTSAKSFMGHAEPAAGLVGLCRLTQMLSESVLDPFVTLRNMNPHVSAALSSGSATSRAFGAREVMPTASRARAVVGGVSAFAFQGTNAHALVEADVEPVVRRSDGVLLEQDRYWVLPPAHPIIQAFAGLQAKSKVARLQGSLAGLRLNHLNDHVVLNRVLLPATAMLETSLAAGKALVDPASIGSTRARTTGNLYLCDMAITAPLVIPTNDSIKGMTVAVSLDTLSGGFVLESATKVSRGAHATGEYCSISFVSPRLDGPGRSALAQISREQVRSALTGAATRSQANAIGSLVVPSGVAGDAYGSTPSTADASLHLGVCVPNCPAKVPVKVGLFGTEANASSFAAGFACTGSRFVLPTEGFDTSSFAVLPPSGECSRIISIADLETKVMRPSGAMVKAVPVADYVYELQNHQVFEPVPGSRSGSVRTLADCRSSIGVRLVSQAGDAQAVQELALRSPPSAADYEAGASLLSALQSIGPRALKHVDVVLTDGIPEMFSSSGSSSGRPPMADGAIEGLMRVFASERKISSTRVQAMDPMDLRRAVSGPVEGPVVCRTFQGSRATPVLARGRSTLISHDLVQLRSNPRGSLNSLVCQEFDQKKLRPDDVSISVKAVGINFRDVLNVLGMYPGDPGPPGSDCAGVVLAVGDNVSHIKAGDPVFGLAHGCLGTAVSGPAQMVVPMPPSVSFAEAATIPTVFTTVHIAFNVASKLQKGQRVLIHASAGGVGLAGIQVANIIGAEVISTAGGPSKRGLLHSLGVKHVVGSRDTKFADEVCLLGGADVVLNSLTSSGMIAASISCLNIGGRFVEISKRDIWSSARFEQERADVGYSLLAVDFLPPSVLHSTLSLISSQLALGHLKPLRQISHTMGSVANAMRQLSQASHVGKVVAVAEPWGRRSAVSSASGTLAVSGGVGGLGLMMSDWISRRNAGIKLCLLGRSGRVSDARSWRQLAATSSQVSVMLADSGFSEDMDDLFRDPGLNVTNFMHSSGVLRDSLLEKQSAASFKQVYAPKTSVLKRHMEALPLESVTLFSSVASLLGGAGQGNYASANSFLDSWAFDSQSSGLYVKAVQWGAWASSGMASEAVLRRLERIGQGMITAEQGLATLHSILSLTPGTLTCGGGAPVIAVNDFNWKVYLKDGPTTVFGGFYEEPAVAAGDAERKGATRTGKAKVKAKQVQMSAEFVFGSVHDAVKQVVGSSVGDDEPLMSAGLDSLGSVEFANVLTQAFSMQMPGTLVFDYPSVRAISEFILGALPKGGDEEESSDEEGVDLALELGSPRQMVPYDADHCAPTVFVKSVNVHAMQRDVGRVAEPAIVGRTGRLADHIRSVPLERWDLDSADSLLGDAKSLSAQFGGFMHGIEFFDLTGYGISQPEAVAMDPQHRLILELAGQALHESAEDVAPSGRESLWAFRGPSTLS